MNAILVTTAILLGVITLIILAFTLSRLIKAFKLMKIRDKIDLSTWQGKLKCYEMNTEINSLLSWRYSKQKT